MVKKVITVLVLVLIIIPSLFAEKRASLINRTEYDVYYVYAAPSGSEDWSSDLLGNGILEAMSYRMVDIPLDVTSMDFLFTDEEGDDYLMSQIRLDSSSKVVLTMDSYIGRYENESERGRDLRLVNDSGYTMYYLYLSPSGRAEWTEDLLGTQVLLDDETFEIDSSMFDDLAEIDLWLVDEDDDNYRINGIQTSEAEEVIVTLADLDYGYGEAAINEYNSSRNLLVQNDTGYTIYYLYISPEYDEEWSADLLGDGVLLNGDSVFVDVPCEPGDCLFDVMAVDEDEDEYYRWGYDYCYSDGELILTFDDFSYNDDENYVEEWDSTREALVINETGYDIWYLYASPVTSDSWGEDLLGSGILYDDESIWVDIPCEEGDCLFDFKAVDVDDDAYLKWEISLCDDNEVVFRLADIDSGTGDDFDFYSDGENDEFDSNSELSLLIENNTGYSVQDIFVSPGSDTEWGPDRLETELLNSGESFIIDLSDYEDCIYDIRLVDVDEDTYTRYSVDVCNIHEQVFTISDIDY